jgi:acetyl esterase/lipase
MRHVAAIVVLVTLFTATPPVAALPVEIPVEVTRDVRYGSADGVALRLDVYSTGSGTSRPAVILLHGGQWVHGDKRDLEPEARRLARLGWVAISVNYRLTGSRWPGEYQDVTQALRWVGRSAASLGVDRNRIAMLGSSSGAHLAALVATKGQPPADGTPPVKAVALWSPPLDLTAPPGSDRTSHLPIPIVERFLGCSETSCPQRYRDASPLFHVNARSVPMYIANSQSEVIPVGAARAMAAALADAGRDHTLRVLPGSVHGLTADCSVTPCRRGYEALVWDETIAFLRARIAGSTAPATGATTLLADPLVPPSRPTVEPGTAEAATNLGRGAMLAAMALVVVAAGTFRRGRRRALGPPAASRTD